MGADEGGDMVCAGVRARLPTGRALHCLGHGRLARTRSSELFRKEAALPSPASSTGEQHSPPIPSTAAAPPPSGLHPSLRLSRFDPSFTGRGGEPGGHR